MPTITGRNTRGLALLAAALVAAALLGACGQSGDTDADLPVVAAGTGVAADIVANVAGDRVKVVQLIPDGAAAHSYSLSARERSELEEAELLVYFSPGLEQSLADDQAAESFVIADNVGLGPEGARDPHVWLDPTLIAASLPELAEALGRVEPAETTYFERRAEEYGRELERLDSEVAALADAVPPARRKLVTSHDLFGYYADRYGYAFVGAPFGVAPEAEASAGDLADLIERIRAEDVPAVFAQEGDDPEVLRRVADEAGVEIVEDLPVESLGGGAETYVEMMQITSERISEALRS